MICPFRIQISHLQRQDMVFNHVNIHCILILLYFVYAGSNSSAISSSCNLQKPATFVTNGAEKLEATDVRF